MALTPVDFDPFAGAPAPASPTPAPAVRPAAQKFTPVDYDPFGGSGPSTGRDASGQMLFPSAFIETPDDPLGDMVTAGARGARAYPKGYPPLVRELADAAAAPDPAPAPVVKPGWLEVITEGLKAGTAKPVAGAIQGLGDALNPLAGVDVSPNTRAALEALIPQMVIGRKIGDVGADVYDMGAGMSQGARVGAINPQSVDELAAAATADPEGTMRFLVATAAESVPAILAAIGTRNPRAAQGLIGTSTYGTTYGQERADGAVPLAANRQAATSALLEVAGSKATIDEVLGAGVSAGRRVITAPGLEAAGEFGTGGGQAASDLVGGAGKKNPDAPALEAVVGALIGGPLGLGEAVVGKGPGGDPAAGIDPGRIDPEVIADVLRKMDSSSTATVLRQGAAPVREAAPAAVRPRPAPVAPVAAPAVAVGDEDDRRAQATAPAVDDGLGDLLLRNLPPEEAAVVADVLAANPELAAQLGDLVAGAAPESGAPAPAVPAAVGGSPVDVGADSSTAAVTDTATLLPEDQRDTAPVGSRVDGGKVPGKGRVVWEVRDVPLDALILPEVAADGVVENRRADVTRYAERMRAGERPPNARGFEGDDGRVKLADGHRRALAARAAGLTSLPVAVATYPDEGGLGDAAAPAPRGTPAAEPEAPFAPGGTMYAQGRNAQAVQLADGSWRVRTKKNRQWQPWEARPTFDASGAFGYRPYTPPGGAVNIDGKQVRLAPKGTPAPKPERSGPPKPTTVLQDLMGAKGFNGLDREAFRAEFGVDPAMFGRARVGIQRVFTKGGTMKPDDLRAWMVESGYLLPERADAPDESTTQDAFDVLERALNGEDVFNLENAQAGAAWTSYERDAEEAYRAQVEATLADQLPDIDDADMPAAIELAIDLNDLRERATAAGMVDFELDPIGDETEVEFRRRLLAEVTNLEGSRNGPDSEADDRNRRPDQAGSVRPTGDLADRGEPAEAGSEPERRDLAGDASPPAAPAPVSRRPSAGGLFAEPTQAERLAAAKADRDAQRDGRTGSGRTDMLSGAGTLFAGNAPPQADLTDDIPFSRSPARASASRVPAVVAAVQRILGTNGARLVTVVRTTKDLPAGLASRVDGRTEGLFDPKTGRVYLIAANVSPERAAWVAAHEVAGHVGLRGMIDQFAFDGAYSPGIVLADTLDAAAANPTVQAVAAAIQRDEPDYAPERAAEEAIAELAAATRTGNFDGIRDRYGVDVPRALRPGLRGLVARIVEAIRALFGRRGAGLSDADVYRLLDDAWQHVAKGGTARADTRPAADRARESRASKPFYSAALRAVQQGNGAPKRGDAAAWKGWLDGAVRRGEMKQSERDWLGIDAWLEGRGQTTRDELAEFIRANEVQVKDVVLGGGARERRRSRSVEQAVDAINDEFNALAPPDSSPEREARAAVLTFRHDMLADYGIPVSDGVAEFLTDVGEAPSGNPDAWERYAESFADMAADNEADAAERGEVDPMLEMAAEATRVAERLRADANEGHVKFAQWQMPGGENYRELLLTLPQNRTALEAANASWFSAIRELTAEVREKMGETESGANSIVGAAMSNRGASVRLLQEGLGTERADAMLDLIRRRREKVDNVTDKNISTRFDGGHFDQPNVVAHVRFNERTDVDGKRVLFIEEIQSDWHQKGRKEGYAAADPVAGAKALAVFDAKMRADAIASLLDNGGAANRADALARVNGMSSVEIAEIMGVGDEFERLESAAKGGIPNAPFKGTDEWAMVAFKRAARWAVDNGFDRIAWTPGDVQNTRYNLANEVDMIVVVPRENAATGAVTRSVQISMKTGRVVTLGIDANGVVDNVGREGPADAKGKGLDEVIGKEMADKIMGVDGRATFEGEGLKVGGKGMRGFYDQILPKAVGRWAKPFGAKVGTTQLSGEGARVVPSSSVSGQFDVIVGEDFNYGTYRTRGEAEAVLETAQRTNPQAGRSAKNTVHSIDITPAMREAVGAGQPLFSRKPRNLTAAQKAAVEKAGLPTVTVSGLSKVSDNLRARWNEVVANLRDPDAVKTAVADRFHGLKVAEARAGISDPAHSPYIAARMTAGLGSVMESLMLFGAPEWKAGAAGIKPGTKGLLDSLKPVEKRLDDWLAWMVGRRAQLLASQGRENNFTQADIAALLSLAGPDLPAFQQAARDYLTIKNAVLDFAEQAGLIDPVARAAWDHAEYLPFYREDPSKGAAIGPGTRRGISNQSSNIRQLKGGTAVLHDPLANIVRNFSTLVDASLKNHAMRLAVDELGATLFTKAPHELKPELIPLDQVKKHLLAQGVPASVVAAMPTAAIKGVGQMLAIKPPSGDDVVRLMRNGKPEYYTVADPLVLRALTAFALPNRGAIVNVLAFFKRLLTAGVTTTAEFVAANFIRDSAAAWVTSDDRFRPGWDSVKGAVNTLRNDQTTKEMMAAGATFLGGQYYNGDADAAAAALRRALRAKGMSSASIQGLMGTVATSPLKVWDTWLRLSSAIENANRRAVYDAAIKAGRSHLEASYLARDLLDFAMRGDAAWMQVAADVLPFFNARVQGLYKLGRRAGTPEGRKAMLLRGSVLAIFSVGLMAWNLAMHGDAYDELEEWDKDAYWHVAPGTPFHLRIPKPFEVGLVFGTSVERMMRAIQGITSGGTEGDRPSQTFKAAMHAITSTLAINPIPQGVLPLVEQWANKKTFTGRPIENMGDDKLLPELREEWYTSDTAKLISDVQAGLAPRALQLSAKRIEHLWTGYTGGLGAYLLEASDAAVRFAQNVGDETPKERPALTVRDLPLVGRFARGDSPAVSTRYTTEFYDLFQRAEEVEQSIKTFAVSGENPERLAELEDENSWLLGGRVASKQAKGGFMFEGVRAMRKVRDQLSQLRQDAEDVANSEALNSVQKREQIDALTAQRNALVRDTVKALRAAEAGGGSGGGGGTGGVREARPSSRARTVWEDPSAATEGPRPVPFPVHNLGNPPRMVMVGPDEPIPDNIAAAFNKGANGAYDPATETVYVGRGYSREHAAHVAFHEIAGHYGLRRVMGPKYDEVMNRARANLTVRTLAAAMQGDAYRGLDPVAAAEEALSELAAAAQTGNYAKVEDSWGVKIPPSARPGIAGVVGRAVQDIRGKVGDLLGEAEYRSMTDGEILDLLDRSWRSVKGDADR